MAFVYPQYLLPKKGQQRITQQDISGYFLIRETIEDIYTKVPAVMNFSEFDFSAQENLAIANNLRRLITQPTSHEDICCLSVCLYGIYTEVDCGIKCIKKEKHDIYYSEWNYLTDPIDVDNSDFEKNEKFPLYFNVSRVLNEPENNRSVYIQNETNDGYVEKKLVVHLIHKPSQINYWHFEFRLFIDEQEIKKEDLKQNKKLSLGIKTFMKDKLLTCIDWQKDTIKFTP